MRILFLSNYALPHLGGIEVVVDALARELSARGHEVRHVTAAALRPGEELTPNDVYRVIRVPAINVLEQQAGVPFPIFSPVLLKILKDELAWADVVHAHGNLYLNSVAALIMARAMRRPVRILTEHVGHVDYERQLLDNTEKLAIATIGRYTTRSAEAIIVLNAKVWHEMAHLAPKNRIVHIANGVDGVRYRPPLPGEREAMRKKLGWDDKPRVLFVGRLVKKKRADLAVAAAAAARGAFELVIVGPGKLEVDQPTDVLALGGQSAERVAEIYRAADAFLLPSHGEGFPLTAQEAMASGLPVVLANDPNYLPYVQGAGPGVRLVEPDPGAIAATLIDLLRDPVRRAEAGRAAHAHATATFSWRRCADQHLALYDEVLAARQTEKRIGFARFDLATTEKLPIIRKLLRGKDGPSESPCLDIGIGTGFQTWRAFEGSFTLAVDAWRPNLEAFRAGLGQGARATTAPVQASGDRLPLRSGSIGTVLCSEVLEHLDDDRAMLSEIARVLRPGGVGVITVPSLYFGFDSYMHLAGMKTVHDFPGPERHVRPGYKAEELTQLCNQAGLEVEEVAYLFRPFTKLAMESVSIAHIAYQFLVHRRRSWNWSDAAQSEGGLAFRAYRAAFPVLQAVASLDRLAPTRGGFGLALRVRRGN